MTKMLLAHMDSLVDDMDLSNLSTSVGANINGIVLVRNVIRYPSTTTITCGHPTNLSGACLGAKPLTLVM